ncbi:hypothetical protein ACN6KF_002397 [Labrys sp. La1]|uniref:hypothetical protein n=1 Tax=Labrys sp. La1 TaxID=3404917 RepID=UPI003EB97E1B
MISLRLAILASCLVLSACRLTEAPVPGQAGALAGFGATGRLLDQGKPVPNIRIRATSSHLPSHSMLTTTDAQGRFRLDASGIGGNRDVLRIEASGEDYHAVGEISLTSLAFTCELESNALYASDKQGHFWSGNDIEWKPGQPIKALRCR